MTYQKKIIKYSDSNPKLPISWSCKPINLTEDELKNIMTDIKVFTPSININYEINKTID